MHCQSNNSYDYPCSNRANFAVWYQGFSESTKGVCGKHLSKTVAGMLTEATEETGQFVKVTDIKKEV